jgi:hypothetical protein
MTNKSDFTKREWEGLLLTPVLAVTYVILSDLSVTAVPAEMKGLMNAMLSQLVPVEADQLISALVADFKQKAQNKEQLDPLGFEKNQETKRQMLEKIQQNLAILDGKATPDEKAAFNGWLVGLAQATAEAGREGGFLGI